MILVSTALGYYLGADGIDNIWKFCRCLLCSSLVSSGSGVTCLGLMLGHEPWSSLLDPRNNRTFHTVCVSGENTIKKKFEKHKIQPSEQIEIVKSEFEFDDMMESYETPFPCNEFWDKKAWYWLEKNIQKFEGRILFWNLGGNW